MNEPAFSEDSLTNASREEIMTALFANMVIQQTNLALMMLGKIPHPQSGEVMQDLESAKIFIDQLEMLEFKTKGNLDQDETALLKQSLDALRLAFVELIDAQVSEPSAAPPPANPASPAGTPKSGPAPESKPPSTEDDSRKKFTKKY